MKIIVTSKVNTGQKYVDLLFDSRLLPKEVNIIFDSKLEQLDATTDFIHVQWPEDLLEWNIDSYNKQNVDQIVSKLKEAQQRGTKVIYTLHNEQPHVPTPAILNLYDQIVELANAVVHLGQYSYKLYQERYPQHTHYLTNLGIYNYPEHKNRTVARQALNIKPNTLTTLVFGHIRNFQEQSFIYHFWNKIIKQEPEACLIAPRFYDAARPNWYRHPLNRIKSEIFNQKKLNNSQLRLGKGFVDDDTMLNLFAAADVLLIPRISGLNSALIYLSLEFNLPIIGPNIGNIEEAVVESQGLIFEAGNHQDAAKKLLNNIHKLPSFSGDLEKYSKLDKFTWKYLQDQHLKLYKSLLESDVKD